MKVKKIISGIVAGAVVLSTLTISAFAASNTDKTSIYTKSISGVIFRAYGELNITQTQYSNDVTITTDTNPLSSTSYASEVDVGWQIVNNNTNQNIGANHLEREYNTQDITKRVVVVFDIASSIIVYGNHSAYKDGSTIFADYTFAFI